MSFSKYGDTAKKSGICDKIRNKNDSSKHIQTRNGDAKKGKKFYTFSKKF